MAEYPVREGEITSMQIRFGCHICGQHLSATDPGSEITCPKCKRTIMVPIRSFSLPSPVPNISPQHQHRAETVQPAVVTRAKVRPSKIFQGIAVIGVIAVGACFVYASHISPRRAPPQAQTYTTAVLKCPTTFQLPNRDVTLPRGSQIEFVSRDELEVRVRYRGHQQSIPASDVDVR
jgi:DNA-directed RNA polymerase subunit RPC12/RpoP